MLKCFGWKCNKKDSCVRYREDRADKTESGAYTTTCFYPKEGTYDLYRKKTAGEIYREEEKQRAMEDEAEKQRRKKEKERREAESKTKKKRGRPKKERIE